MLSLLKIHIMSQNFFTLSLLKRHPVKAVMANKSTGAYICFFFLKQIDMSWVIYRMTTWWQSTEFAT